MNIEEIEYTPNPNAVKFIVDEQLVPPVGGQTLSFETDEEAETNTLASDLMEFEHVETVFYAANYITITQDGEADWRELMREVADPIRDASAEDARESEADIEEGDEGDDEELEGMDDPRMPEIREALEEEIIPYLEGDGGGLEIKGLVDDELLIDYQGACGSCPASITGTLMSIEHLLKREVDEKLSVEAVGGMPGAGAPGAPGAGPMGF